MRKDAKCGLAIGVAIVAVAAPLVLIAHRHSSQPPLPTLSASTPATQPAKPKPSAALRYYRDRAGNLLEHPLTGKSKVIAEKGLFVTCLTHPGRAYAILSDPRQMNESIRIIRCAADAKYLSSQTITDEDLNSVLHIDRMILLPGSRLFIEGEINPSLGIGVEVAKTGADHRCFFGFDFSWNAAGTSVAYLRDPPHWGTPPNIRSEVCIDGRPVRNISQGSEAKLRWISDGVTLVLEVEDSPPVKIDARTAPAIATDF